MWNETMTVSTPLTSDGFGTDEFINTTVPTDVCELDVGGAKRNECVMFNFVFNAIIIGTLCVVGMVGNIVSLMVLQRDRCNRVAGFLLQSLAVADCAVLLVSVIVCSIFVGAIPYFHPHSALAQTFRPYIIKYVQPLGYMSQTLTIWTTVLLAINRYIGICLPFEAPVWCTMRRAVTQVIVVVVVSIAFNFPRFFQFGIFVDGCGRHTVGPTSIGEHTLFGILYTNALFTIVVLLLPLGILIVLNGKVITELRNYKKRRNCLVNSSFITTRGEKSITLVMVIIIFVFLVCHTPDRIFQMLKGVLPGQGCDSVKYYLMNICNLLVILNSSTNFFIYFVFRKRFRKIFYVRFCACVSMWRREKPEMVEAQVPYTALVSLRGSVCSQMI